MIKLFDNISLTNQGKLLNILKAHSFTFKKGSTILSTVKGDNIIGFVQEGSINIVQNDYNGEQITIEKLEEDDVFGSIFLPIEKDDYEIISKEDCKIVIVDYENITKNNTLCNHSYYRQFINNLLTIEAEKLKERNERIDLLSKKTIRNKLLEYFEIKTNNRITKNIYLPFSFIDLANYLSIDRSAMHRELRNLQDEGLIEIKNKKITLKY